MKLVIPQPIPLLEKPTEKVGSDMPKYTAFYLNEEDYLSNMHKTIGMELEFVVKTTPSKRRVYEEALSNSQDYLLYLAKQRNMSNLNTISALDYNNIGSGFRSSNCAFLNYIAKHTSFAIKDVHYDPTCGPELGISPVSLKALPVFKYELARILNNAVICSCMDKGRGAGVHLTADYRLFGEGQERRRNLNNYYLFSYYNANFITELSNRPVENEDMADFHVSVIGNTTNENMKMLRAISAKHDFVDTIMSNKNNRTGPFTSTYGVANHVSQANGLPLLEIRIFGSTTEIDVLMSYLEYVFCVSEFSKHLDYDLNNLKPYDTQDSLTKFTNFVKSNKNKYPHLNNRMLKMYNIDYISEQVSQPTINVASADYWEKVKSEYKEVLAPLPTFQETVPENEDTDNDVVEIVTTTVPSDSEYDALYERIYDQDVTREELEDYCDSSCDGNCEGCLLNTFDEFNS